MSQEKLASHRRLQLLAWMERYEINRTELAKRLEVGRAYISLLLIERTPGENQKTRHFGEKSARSIEAKLGMPVGYLDDDGDAATVAIARWDLVAALPAAGYALVPRINIAIVNGELVSTEVALPALAFTRAWLESRKVLALHTLRTMEVTGDSMTEYLQSGDMALVDTAQTQVEDRAIYAIKFASELRIKRLEKTFSGGMRIISDNASYKTEELSAEVASGLLVIGKLLYRQG